MIFQDNVIKEYLKNVYFITGTPCGGKTTVSRALAESMDLNYLMLMRDSTSTKNVEPIISACDEYVF